MAFERRVDEALARWLVEYTSLQGRKVIFYHNSWPYFSERFGLETVQFLEPKPGVPPSPTHLNRLLTIIEEDNVKLVAMEPYFSDQATSFLARKTGVQVVKLAQSVGALPEADSYLEMFEYNLRALAMILGD